MPLTIIVAVKQVPDTLDARIDPKTNTLVRSGLPSTMNPFDEIAVEVAVRLRAEHGGRVKVLTMGPSQAEKVLRTAFAMCADEGVLLTDPAFAGADTWATALTLATAMKKMGPADLYLFGKQATDGDTAQVGPEVAAILGLPQITYAIQIRRLDLDARSIIAERLLEKGREVVKAPLPALVTVAKGIAAPHYPDFATVKRSGDVPIDIWRAHDIGLAPAEAGLNGSPTMVKKVFTPEHATKGEILEGDLEHVIPKFVDKVFQG